MVRSLEAIAARKRDDIEMIRSPRLWPQRYLRLKTQPWAAGADGKSRFGRMEQDDQLTVYTDDGEPMLFDCLEQLTEVWGVD